MIGFGAVDGGVVVFGARSLWRVVFGGAVHRSKVLTVVLRYRNRSLLSKYICKGSVENRRNTSANSVQVKDLLQILYSNLTGFVEKERKKGL